VRRQVVGLVLAAIATLGAGCATTVSGNAVAADKSGALAPPPVAVSALDPLLLDPDQINTALGATAMKVWYEAKGMWDWSASVSDVNCLAIDGPAQDHVYADTGWTGMRGRRLDDSPDDSKKRTHYAIEAVVAFPSAHDASAFYDSSKQSWVACSNRRYNDVAPGKPDTIWTVASISNDNGTLSTSQVQEGGDGWSCQRALTVRNNVAIDVVGCSYSFSGTPVNDMVTQIAARVAKQ
jgi:PknH-like extracellular domain